MIGFREWYEENYFTSLKLNSKNLISSDKQKMAALNISVKLSNNGMFSKILQG